MTGNLLLLLAALYPILSAPFAWKAGQKSGKSALNALSLIAAGALALLLTIAVLCFGTAQPLLANNLTIPGFCGMGLKMKADGFRMLYVCIASVMWLFTSVFSRDYLAHAHAQGRYAFFTLLTFGATIGLFLADSLFSAFVFFEVMSLASYPWVAHEEEPEAMRAAETYLYVAVIGGLVMLMGIFLLPNGMATASYADIPALGIDANTLWLPGLLILFGFGAKAGMFPLHIWLPKAHPVAPAPASALLSGLLTKAGVLGMLILTVYVLRGNTAFAGLLFRLGVVTMFLGALLAIFSTNLKRTLACSSLSQIGFIMVGVGTQGLCHFENGLAAFGTIQHMMNHSLFKLVLFMSAGVVAMNAGALALDDVRGFGRKKKGLHFAFLLAALGISGIPLLSGYASKSLLHEGLLEYIHELKHLGESALPYEIAEWVFILSGGMTLCYMTKLYICLFWQKHPTRQAEFDGMTNYLGRGSMACLLGAACLVPLFGCLPGVFMTGAGRLAQGFFSAADPAHLPIPYFSVENLVGACKSIAIGVVLFFLQRRFVMDKGSYPNRWPKWLDLEDGVYRPLLRLLCVLGGAAASFCDGLMNVLIYALCGAGAGIATALDWAMDGVIILLNALGGFIARLLDKSGDSAAFGVRRLFLKPLTRKQPVPVGNRFTYRLGLWLDHLPHFGKGGQTKEHFESWLAAGQKELSTLWKRFTRSVTFGLLMACAGLLVTLGYLLWF